MGHHVWPTSRQTASSSNPTNNVSVPLIVAAVIVATSVSGASSRPWCAVATSVGDGSERSALHTPSGPAAT